jgi:chemotaxis protein methyltransferase CheR
VPPDVPSAIRAAGLADWQSHHGAVAGRHPPEIAPNRIERPPVTPPDYEYLRKLLKDRSGLDLSADKQYLIESRLLPLSRKSGLAGISELVQKMKGGSADITTQVVEAMTTNETFFFRDKVPFDHFRDSIMPEILQARASRKTLRIWCAAGSTGQEPYSLAMCLKEMGAALSGWRVEILATDLSQEVLEKSRAGIYSQFEVQRGLPIQMLVKYFKQTGELWQINADIRAMVQHRQLNLLHDFSQLGVFDVIFCRNVLIYFDQDTKINIFNRLAKTTEPDGFLVLGAAETVVGLTDVFKPYPERRGLYRPSGARAAPAKMPAIGAVAPKLAVMGGR